MVTPVVQEAESLDNIVRCEKLFDKITIGGSPKTVVFAKSSRSTRVDRMPLTAAQVSTIIRRACARNQGNEHYRVWLATQASGADSDEEIAEGSDVQSEDSSLLDE